MKPVTFHQVRDYRLMNGLPWFTSAWSVNLFIIRSNHVGLWDDLVVAACYDDSGREVLIQNNATSSASLDQWVNPANPNGCVYVLDGHYSGGYRFVAGGFNGRDALLQQVNFNNVRWPPDRGYVPTADELEAWAAEGNNFWDNRSTHLHNRYNYKAPPRPEPGETEGCTEDLYQHEHSALMQLVQTQGDAGHGLTVSPTFVRRKELERFAYWKAS